MSARRSLVLLLAAAAEDVARVAANAHHMQEVVGSPAIAVVVVPVGTLALGRVDRIRITRRANEVGTTAASQARHRPRCQDPARAR